MRRLRWLLPRPRVALIRVAALVLLSFTVIRMVAPVAFHLASGELRARVTPALPGGRVALDLGPFGELSWRVHHGPINIEAQFLIGQNVSSPPSLDQVENLYGRFVLRKIGWLLLGGGLAGGLVVSGSRRRVAIAAGIGAISSVAAAALAVGVSFLTFDSHALASAHYRGPIEDAPRVVTLLKEVQHDWEGTKRNIGDMIAGLQRIHSQIVAANAPVPAAGTVKLLLVSDLHNNPLGLILAKQLANQFGVDGVLDAGDFTDRGTKLEGELFARFGDLDLPHVIVAGNHEDVQALARVKTVPGATVLEAKTEDTTKVAGITVLGASDPNAYFVDSDPRNQRALEAIPVDCKELADRFQVVQPEILLVHNAALGECAADLAEERGTPLIFVWGHLHRQSYQERGTVISVSPGTSGANGIKTGSVAPYGFAMLEFASDTHILQSTCLFLFDTPTQMREVDCHVRPGGVLAG